MKTTIKSVAVLCACLAPSVGMSQIGLGVTAGVATGSVRMTDVDNSFIRVIEGNNIMGLEGGLYLKVPAGPVYFRPQLLYSYAGGTVDFENTDGGGGSTNFNLHRIQAPLSLGLEVFGPVAIEGSLVYNGIIQVTERYGSETLLLGRTGFGYRIGPAVGLGPVLFHVSYEGATFPASGNRVAFREPYRLIFGMGVRVNGS